MVLHPNSKFVKQLVTALGLEKWRRIIIDIRFDDVATIYIEQLIDEEKLGEIDLVAGIVVEDLKVDK
jgi:hypothetical protein